MSLVVLLPIFKVQVEFQAKHGRRWTPFEHLLLWALGQKGRTVRDLSAETGAPARIVIEALINLMHRGWVEIQSDRSSVRFVITAVGLDALQQSDLPHDFQYLRRYRTFYLDRLEDTVLRTEGVKLVHYQKAKEIAEAQNALLIEPSVYKATLRPFDILEKLALDPDDQFEAWLDQRVLGASLYAVLKVVGNQIVGLPEGCEYRLCNSILELVRSSGKAEAADDGSDKTPPNAPRLSETRGFKKVSFDTADIIVGGDEHLASIKRALANASSYIIIHSTFLKKGAVDLLLPELEACARRHVEIDIIWGDHGRSGTDGANDSAVQVRRLDEHFKNLGLSKFRISLTPTGSHCKMILADCGEQGAYEAIVGSCNWLSGLSTTYKAIDVSIRILDAGLLRDVAYAVAALLMPPSGRWDRSVMRLVRIAEKCRNQKSKSAANAGAMLIFDDDHYVAVRNARDAAQTSIVAGCDWFGTAAETSVFVPMRSANESTPTLSTRIFYQRPDKRVEQEVEAVVAELSSSGVELLHCDKLHGKFLIWDENTIVVSSFNWLSTASRGYNAGASEVGVLIERAGIGSALKLKLAAEGCPAIA